MVLEIIAQRFLSWHKLAELSKGTFFNYVDKRRYVGVGRLFVNSYTVENVTVGGRWSKKAKILST